TSSGTLLGAAQITTSQTGWVQIDFARPVAISANTTYIASYTVPAKGSALNRYSYAYTVQGLSTAVDSGVLHALAGATSGGNGVFGASGTFPTSSTSNNFNYWVDVVFSNQGASIG